MLLLLLQADPQSALAETYSVDWGRVASDFLLAFVVSGAIATMFWWMFVGMSNGIRLFGKDIWKWFSPESNERKYRRRGPPRQSWESRKFWRGLWIPILVAMVFGWGNAKNSYEEQLRYIKFREKQRLKNTR